MARLEGSVRLSCVVRLEGRRPVLGSLVWRDLRSVLGSLVW